VKTWLFTTLHRQFLQSRRRQVRFPHEELTAVETQLPVITPTAARQIDAHLILLALQRVDEVYRAPLALFYLEDTAYKDIAEILEIPMGTVKSRIARGIAQLQRLLAENQPINKPGARSA
jgi:RNA polymerase sigma-70 factor (ECF subfamily)